jgi:hypothetical protein
MILTIRIAGHLDSRWLDWFDGLNMHHLPDGNTELSGSVTDQAALYGLLTRARDLGLTLLTVSVETVDSNDESSSSDFTP